MATNSPRQRDLPNQQPSSDIVPTPDGPPPPYEACVQPSKKWYQRSRITYSHGESGWCSIKSPTNPKDKWNHGLAEIHGVRRICLFHQGDRIVSAVPYGCTVYLCYGRQSVDTLRDFGDILRDTREFNRVVGVLSVKHGTFIPRDQWSHERFKREREVVAVYATADEREREVIGRVGSVGVPKERSEAWYAENDVRYTAVVPPVLYRPSYWMKKWLDVENAHPEGPPPLTADELEPILPMENGYTHFKGVDAKEIPEGQRFKVHLYDADPFLWINRADEVFPMVLFLVVSGCIALFVSGGY